MCLCVECNMYVMCQYNVMYCIIICGQPPQFIYHLHFIMNANFGWMCNNITVLYPAIIDELFMWLRV